MAEKTEKKEERTLEMRIAALEKMLGAGAQQVEFTEQEVAAYNKIADALGVDPCRVQNCHVPPCRVNSCRLQPYFVVNLCRLQPCVIQPCISQPIGQCLNQCVACYAGGYEGDLSGGFRKLGY